MSSLSKKRIFYKKGNVGFPFFFLTYDKSFKSVNIFHFQIITWTFKRRFFTLCYKKVNFVNIFNMQKKVLIVGGGVAGLCCGIQCQKYGFETMILEKTNSLGGNLTGWFRNGCYIDNCIHWLNGSLENSPLNKLFKDVGALDENTKFHQDKYFFVSEYNEKRIGLHIDLSVTEKEMKSACPEDIKEIDKFIKATKLCVKILKAKSKLNCLSSFLSLFSIYKRKTLSEVAKDCKSQLLKNFFVGYMLGEYSIYVLLFVYASFLQKDTKVPTDGSLCMAKRISKKYESLGGKFLTNTEIEKAEIRDDKIMFLKAKNGEEFSADYYVFSCDAMTTFNKLLGKKFMPKKLVKTFKDRKNYPVISSFHVAYDIALDKLNIPDSLIFDCNPITIGVSQYNTMVIRNYDYGINYAPNGHSVLQVFLLQREQDYDYFASLSKKEYDEQKKILSQKITEIIIKKFPHFKDKISILDCWTPLSYTHYFNAYKGSYLCFGLTKKVREKSLSAKIPHCENGFLATQWQRVFGGLPNALKEGLNCAKVLYLKDISHANR